MPWNPTTAVFLQVDKNNYWQAGWSGMWWGYENIYRANPALPSPLRGQYQSHLSKTTSNNTSKEYHNCRISRVFQIWYLQLRNHWFIRLSPSFQKISIFPRFLVFHQNISNQQKKKKILYLSAFYDFSLHFFTELMKSDPIVWPRNGMCGKIQLKILSLIIVYTNV